MALYLRLLTFNAGSSPSVHISIDARPNVLASNEVYTSYQGEGEKVGVKDGTAEVSWHDKLGCTC